MISIKCPYCDRDKSLSDLVCPKCGGTETAERMVDRYLESRRPMQRRRLYLILTAALGAGIVAAIIEPRRWGDTHVVEFAGFVAMTACTLIGVGISVRLLKSKHADKSQRRSHILGIVGGIMTIADAAIITFAAENTAAFVGISVITAASLVLTVVSVSHSKREIARLTAESDRLAPPKTIMR